MSAPTVPLAFLRFGVQSSPHTRIKRTTLLRPVPARPSTRTGAPSIIRLAPHVRVGDLLTEAPADCIRDDPARERVETSSEMRAAVVGPANGIRGGKSLGQA